MMMLWSMLLIAAGMNCFSSAISQGTTELEKMAANNQRVYNIDACKPDPNVMYHWVGTTKPMKEGDECTYTNAKIVDKCPEQLIEPTKACMCLAQEHGCVEMIETGLGGICEKSDENPDVLTCKKK